MACHSIALAPLGRYATGSRLVCLMAAVAAMTTMAPMSEYVHSDEGYGDQYPNPVR
jgi:hypothetical protein